MVAASALHLAASMATLAAPTSPGGFAVSADRVFALDAEDHVFTPGMVIFEGGRISYVGVPVEPPVGFECVVLEGGWIVPGMVDLHTHVHSGGFGDTNDMVHSVNPELSAAPALRPANRLVQIGCAAGVTTLFGIPGSGTNMSGFGVLYKAKTSGGFDEVVMADPGGLKVAQDSNPERRAGDFAFGNGRASMSWTLEDVAERARGATRAERFDPALTDLQKVMARELPVLIHTAGSEGVANTARMWKEKFDTRCVISHGSFDGWKTAAAIAAWGVPVNHGPRTMDFQPSRNGRINGTAAEYVAAGVPLFSLNTDSSVIPQEELFLQGAMSARYGADPYLMLRALTIHPAQAFGIDDRVGSLEPGKDADVVVWDGDPLDPRSKVLVVFIDGRIEYEYKPGAQTF